MIRESMEFSREELYESEINGSDNGLIELMYEVNKLSQRKMDKEIYK